MHLDGRIRKLSGLLIDQIAAGEVVDRPASVVKELVENSFDANANTIHISLAEGGLKEISVGDNGKGIHPEDLSLAFERHATSKISSLNDLQNLSFFGFRGEALSSIASVSQIKIRTCTQEDQGALSYQINFGEVTQSPRPCAGNKGTWVEVAHLFERLPARQKFLRSASTELSHCIRIVKGLALGNPEVQVQFQHNNRRVFSLMPQDRWGRFQDCFNTDWTPVHLREESEAAQLEAFLSPTHRVQDRGEIHAFVNRRVVRNRALQAAVRQAYLEVMGKHHEPSGALFLDIRSEWIDANVHPQKWEVRFLKQEALFSWVLASVRKFLQKSQSIRILEIPVPTAPTPIQTLAISEPVRDYTPIEQKRDSPPIVSKQEASTAALQLHYLGQFRASYLLCEDDLGLLLIDQHALHEKVRYEELLENFNTQTIPSQQLLIPQLLSIPSHLFPLLMEHISAFSEIGFEIEPFGENDFMVKAIPVALMMDRVAPTIEQALQDWIAGKKETNGWVSSILASVACHSVVRANQRLSNEQARALIDSIHGLSLGWTCPHGRPVIFRLPLHQIQKYFERV